MIELLLPIIICAVGLAFLAGPLGTLVVWRRLAYFGDTLAHGALLGVALGIAVEVHTMLAVAVVAISMGLLLWQLEKRVLVSTDSLLGTLSHTSLAFGLVLLSFFENAVNLDAILFGDLLSLSLSDAAIIFILAAVTNLFLVVYWRQLLLICLDTQLAKVEGVAVEKLNMMFTIILAVVIAVAIKLVGVLLITALLIIPAVTARRLSASPEKMIGVSTLVAVIATCSGIFLSWHFDTPAGPSIVVSAALLFAASLISRQR